MADYSQPFQPNVLSNAYAANQLQNLFNSQQLQNDLQDAGKVAATGDYLGASNQLASAGHYTEAQQMRNLYDAQQKASAEQKTQGELAAAGKSAAGGNYDAASGQLLGQGHFEEAKQIQTMAKNANDAKLKDMQSTYEKLGNLARLATTPEQWGQAVAAAQQHGLNTQGYEDFNTGRQLAIAMSGQVSEALKDEEQRRNAEAAKFKGATTYNVNMPSGESITSPDGVTRVSDGPEVQKMVPGTIMRLPSGEWTTPIATPEGVDMTSVGTVSKGGKGEAAAMAAPHEIMSDYKKAYGDDLDFGTAQAASKSGATVVKGEDGKPKVVALGSTLQSNRDLRTQQNTQKLDPSQIYQRALAAGIGKKDADNLGRVQQLDAVLGHTKMIEDSVGGPELDNSKLTEDQLQKRQVAEDSIGYLKTKAGYGVLTGVLNPQSDTPDFLKNLRQTQIMLEGELTRLATMGQGAVAEGIRNHLQGTIGELAASPSIKNIINTAKTIREMSSVIGKMPMIGKPQDGLINPELRSGFQTQGEQPKTESQGQMNKPAHDPLGLFGN